MKTAYTQRCVPSSASNAPNQRATNEPCAFECRASSVVRDEHGMWVVDSVPESRVTL